MAHMTAPHRQMCGQGVYEQCVEKGCVDMGSNLAGDARGVRMVVRLFWGVRGAGLVCGLPDGPGAALPPLPPTPPPVRMGDPRPRELAYLSMQGRRRRVTVTGDASK